MSQSEFAPIKRALISVSDKTQALELARELASLGVALLSTGGTYRLLAEAGLSVTEVADYTGFPEMMDGRVKTLHPKIHGGILGRRGQDDAVMRAHAIEPIDLVVINLYPFEKTVATPDCSLEDAIENIDIGGPTMVRAAAKNYRHVAVVVDPARYQPLLAELRANDGQLSLATRFELALTAFEHTAAYDGAIANYLGRKLDDNAQFPRTFNLQMQQLGELRYGENPHQRAAFYRERDIAEACVASAELKQGKPLSYNNVADADAALETVKLFEAPACVIVKHANPCGVAVAADIGAAYDRAYETDPESAFGGIIAFNRPLDGATASAIVERQFVEVIIAPSAAPQALAAVASKPNVRLLLTGELPRQPMPALDFKRITGGLLMQDKDIGMVDLKDLEVMTKRSPTDTELQDLLFAWKVAKMVKSNAIVYARDGQTLGVGAGQMSRVNSARIAAIKAEHAGLKLTGCAMASDAFFPFRDGIDNAAAAGVGVVIQPGGSKRDEEVIAAADEHQMAMVFTKMRHFRH